MLVLLFAPPVSPRATSQESHRTSFTSHAPEKAGLACLALHVHHLSPTSPVIKDASKVCLKLPVTVPLNAPHLVRHKRGE